MRYLKLFNEGKGDLQEFTNFCEMQLAFLIDEGFQVNIGNDKSNFCQIKIKLPNGQNFKWIDIRDSFLPFLHFLRRNWDSFMPRINFIYYDANKFKQNNYGYLNNETFTLNKVLLDTFQMETKTTTAGYHIVDGRRVVKREVFPIVIKEITITGIKFSDL